MYGCRRRAHGLGRSSEEHMRDLDLNSSVQSYSFQFSLDDVPQFPTAGQTCLLPESKLVSLAPLDPMVNIRTLIYANTSFNTSNTPRVLPSTTPITAQMTSICTPNKPTTHSEWQEYTRQSIIFANALAEQAAAKLRSTNACRSQPKQSLDRLEPLPITVA